MTKMNIRKAECCDTCGYGISDYDNTVYCTKQPTGRTNSPEYKNRDWYKWKATAYADVCNLYKQEDE